MAEKKCKHCAMMIPKEASTCPHCRKSQGFGCLTTFIAIIGVIIIFFIFLAIQSKDDANKNFSETTNPLPHDDLSLFVSKYGDPDVDDSTQYDKPRPPIVTRWLIYKKEHVEALYVPSGVSIDDPPPYRKWKFIGFVDDKTKQPISPDEAVNRLRLRLR